MNLKIFAVGLAALILGNGGCLYAQPYIPDKETIGLWHLDEEETAIDSSEGKNHGTIHKTKLIEGKFGKALEFDGKDSVVEVPFSPSLEPPKFTIECWIYPYERRDAPVLGNNTEQMYGFYLRTTESGGIRFGFVDAGRAEVAESGGDYLPNEWVHIAGTWDGKYLKVYINDKLVKSSGDVSEYAPDYSKSKFLIGKGWWEARDSSFYGKIDEVRFSSSTSYIPGLPQAGSYYEPKEPVKSTLPSWYEFVGTCGQIEPEQRAGILRDPDAVWETALLVSKPTPETETLTGKFSKKERYFDFKRTERMVDKYQKDGKFIFPCLETTVGIDNLLAEEGNLWKDIVYASVVHFNTGKYKDTPILYWQLGNEINAVEYFNPLKLDLGKINQWDHFNSNVHGEKYAEYFFAPSCEAIEMASEDIYQDKDRIKVVLGSAALGYSIRSQEWINGVLKTEIKGEIAPSLKGEKVYEHTDIISLHYFMAANPEEPGHKPWWKTLEDFYQEWLKSGIVEGLWNTEETPRYGGIGLLVSTFRQLDWWSRHEWAPLKSMSVFWGDWWAEKTYPVAILSEQLAGDYLKDNPILNWTPNLEVKGEGKVEAYAFKTNLEKENGNFLIVIFPGGYVPSSLDISKKIRETLKVEEIYLKNVPSGTPEIAGKRLIAEKGVENIKVEPSMEKNGIKIKLKEVFEKDDRPSVLVVFVSFVPGDYGWALKEFKPGQEKNKLISNGEILSFNMANWIGEAWSNGGIDEGMEGDKHAFVAASVNEYQSEMEISLLNDYSNFKKVKFEINYGACSPKGPGELYWDGKLLTPLEENKSFNEFWVSPSQFNLSPGKHNLLLKAGKSYWLAVDAIKIEGEG